MEQALKGKVAVVAGATRGAGRGIAAMLGEKGATVYCTGRSVRGNLASGHDRPETIEETAEMVTHYGGVGIAVRVDHSQEDEVKALFERVQVEQGRLDILVNDVWGGETLINWEQKFWEADLDKGFQLLKQAVFTHIITSRYGAPLMLPHRTGVIIEITDGDKPDYRGNLFYDIVKSTVIRLAFDMSHELRPHNIAAVAVTPGFLRSEFMLDLFGVTETNWQDGAKQDPYFIASETPFFVGRAVAALAADPNIMAKTGQALSSWGLSDEYHFTDIDGRSPHWGRYFAEHPLASS